MKKTSPVLQAMRQRGDRITVLTCYDYPTALWQEAAGVDVIFVADSVGTNMLGYGHERDVTMDDMVHHLKAVRRGVQEAYLLVDLPYGSCDTPDQALENALRLVSLGADGVKLEGDKADVVKALTERGIDTWAHLGLNPQLHDRKRLQARTMEDAVELVAHALALQDAGASFLVLELIPEEVAELVTRRLSIPTIGIGAGRFTSGQVLVVPDLLGINDLDLRHVSAYADFRGSGLAAIERYVAGVRSGEFPGQEHAWHLSAEALKRFRAWEADHPH